MPSNFTPNYQLNQWEPDDRVLRTDFNADNAKIDAALAGKMGVSTEAGRMYPTTGTFTGTASRILPFDWNKYEYITVVTEFPAGVTNNGTISLTLSGDSRPLATIPSENHALVLCPRHDSSRKITGLLLCSKPVIFTSELTYDRFSVLEIKYVSGTVPDYHGHVVCTP